MKKILYGFVTILLLTVFSNQVLAEDSLTFTLEGNDTFEYDYNLRLIIDSFQGLDEGLFGLSGTLSYDKEKLKLVNVKALYNYDLTFDKKKSDTFVTTFNTGLYPGSNLVNIKFKNKGLEDGESTVITLNNVYGGDGNKEIAATCIPKTVTFDKPLYQKGDLNHNGRIDLADIIILLKRYLGSLALNEEDEMLADTDFTNDVGLNDIIILLQDYLES